MIRAIRALAGSVLAASLLAVWLVLTAIDGRAILLMPSVHLTPSHGQAAAGFTATYTLSPCQVSTGSMVDFYWDDYPPNGAQRLGSAPTDPTCAARLATAPPVGASTGSHLVYGFVALPDGSPLNGTLAAAAYTVDAPVARATPTPTASSVPASPAPSGATNPGSSGPGSSDDHDSRLLGGPQGATPGAGVGPSTGGTPRWLNTPLGQVSLLEAIFAAVLLALLVAAAIFWLVASPHRKEKQAVDKAA